MVRTLRKAGETFCELISFSTSRTMVGGQEESVSTASKYIHEIMKRNNENLE